MIVSDGRERNETGGRSSPLGQGCEEGSITEKKNPVCSLQNETEIGGEAD